MTPDNQGVRIAVLETEMSTLKVFVERNTEAHQQIAKDLGDIVANFRLIKWILGVALAFGPSLAVLIFKVLDKVV